MLQCRKNKNFVRPTTLNYLAMFEGKMKVSTNLRDVVQGTCMYVQYSKSKNYLVSIYVEQNLCKFDLGETF